MNKDRRFIEESFPVKEVSIESAREKNIRQGHISTLHIWWARRPLASSRATNYAALIPACENTEEVKPLLEDVKRWGAWVLEKAKAEIGRYYPEDPGGSIPVGYIWARIIPCQNPACGAEIPLMRQFFKIYNTLVMLAYLMETMGPNSWNQRLNNLFIQHPQVSASSMGFPHNWRTMPIWRDMETSNIG